MVELLVEPLRRRIVENFIRGIDIVAYFIILMAGVYALFLTPLSVITSLAGWEWLIPWWSGFLLIGGLFGLIGRISTIWMFEPPADIAAFIGILIYFIVLGQHALETITTATAALLVFVALLGVIRRYLELQLFGSEPGDHKGYVKLKHIWSRRIPTVPPRG